MVFATILYIHTVGGFDSQLVSLDEGAMYSISSIGEPAVYTFELLNATVCAILVSTCPERMSSHACWCVDRTTPQLVANTLLDTIPTEYCSTVNRAKTATCGPVVAGLYRELAAL